MFQRAREKGASGAGFEAMIKRLERELDTEWNFSELQSPHFAVSFAEGANQLAARFVLESLEEAYEIVGHKLSFYPQERISVVLYAQEQFYEVSLTPRWAGGVYDGRIKVPVHGLDERSAVLDRTLRHEYAHVVVSRLCGGRCPVWLREGVAIWAEETTAGERTQWALTILDEQPLFTIAELQGPFLDLPESRVSAAYAQSYMTVRLLLDTYEAHRLLELLTELANGARFEQAFETTFATSLSSFESELQQEIVG